MKPESVAGTIQKWEGEGQTLECSDNYYDGELRAIADRHARELTAHHVQLREIAALIEHSFLAATDDERHVGHLADENDDQSEWIIEFDARCNRCALDRRIGELPAREGQ